MQEALGISGKAEAQFEFCEDRRSPDALESLRRNKDPSFRTPLSRGIESVLLAGFSKQLMCEGSLIGMLIASYKARQDCRHLGCTAEDLFIARLSRSDLRHLKAAGMSGKRSVMLACLVALYSRGAE